MEKKTDVLGFIASWPISSKFKVSTFSRLWKLCKILFRISIDSRFPRKKVDIRKNLKSLTHVLSFGRFIVPSNGPVFFALLHLHYVLGSSAIDLLMCRSWNFGFEYYIISLMFFFQLIKTSFKLRKIILLLKVFLFDQGIYFLSKK